VSSELDSYAEQAFLETRRKLRWAEQQLRGVGRAVASIGLQEDGVRTRLLVAFVDGGEFRSQTWSLRPEEESPEGLAMLVYAFVSDPAT
jgi:hypothetical protein